MYKVILIDDESLARKLIKSYLQTQPEFEVVAECADGFEGFKAIQEHSPDLIFLDVQMPKVNGFEMLELLDQAPSVIFTTAFDDYALKAFDAHAVDYLLKPVTAERFRKAISRWKEQAAAVKQAPSSAFFEEVGNQGYQQRLVVKDQGTIRIIPSQNIHYIEASDDYIKIVSSEGKFLKKATLTQTEKLLDPKQFVRVHRSYLIPVSQLLKIEPYEKESHVARLQCGVNITVSKSGLSRLKQVLGW